MSENPCVRYLLVIVFAGWLLCLCKMDVSANSGLTQFKPEEFIIYWSDTGQVTYSYKVRPYIYSTDLICHEAPEEIGSCPTARPLSADDRNAVREFSEATLRDRTNLSPVLATPSSPFTPSLPITVGVAAPTMAGKALVVDQTAQMMFVYEDGVQIRIIPVSTGVRMSYTPAFRGQVGHYVSTFYSFGTFVDHAWYLTRATGNIYIHGAPYTVVDGQKVYQGLEFLGSRSVSHGCIRVHPDDAEWLFQWNPIGVNIVVTVPDFSKDG